MEAVLNRGASAEIGPGKCLRDERLTSDLWDALDSVLARACDFDPARRYSNANELLAALPVAVLGLHPSHGVATQEQRPAAIALTVAERVALSDIIAECPSSEERTRLYHVREKTRLNEYHFAISVRRLEDVGFLQSASAEDDYGNRYTLVQPTSNAVAWAHDHADEIASAIDEVAPKRANDDDIPF
jgi:hypothetical protein